MRFETAPSVKEQRNKDAPNPTASLSKTSKLHHKSWPKHSCLEEETPKAQGRTEQQRTNFPGASTRPRRRHQNLINPATCSGLPGTNKLLCVSAEALTSSPRTASLGRSRQGAPAPTPQHLQSLWWDPVPCPYGQGAARLAALGLNCAKGQEDGSILRQILGFFLASADFRLCSSLSTSGKSCISYISAAQAAAGHTEQSQLSSQG